MHITGGRGRGKLKPACTRRVQTVCVHAPPSRYLYTAAPQRPSGCRSCCSTSPYTRTCIPHPHTHLLASFAAAPQLCSHWRYVRSCCNHHASAPKAQGSQQVRLRARGGGGGSRCRPGGDGGSRGGGGDPRGRLGTHLHTHCENQGGVSKTIHSGSEAW